MTQDQQPQAFRHEPMTEADRDDLSVPHNRVLLRILWGSIGVAIGLGLGVVIILIISQP